MSSTEHSLLERFEGTRGKSFRTVGTQQELVIAPVATHWPQAQRHARFLEFWASRKGRGLAGAEPRGQLTSSMAAPTSSAAGLARWLPQQEGPPGESPQWALGPGGRLPDPRALRGGLHNTAESGPGGGRPTESLLGLQQGSSLTAPLVQRDHGRSSHARDGSEPPF